MRRLLRATSLFLVLTLALGLACSKSDDDNPVDTGDKTPPTAVLTYPANASSVSGTVVVTADAADNVGVTAVQFFINGVQAAVDSASPYSYAWDTSPLADNTHHTIYAKAFDAAGNSGLSLVVTVTVSNAPPDVTAPADIADLTVTDSTVSTVTLAWTAPGDDGTSGTATAYEIRYALAPITEANWNLAVEVTSAPSPGPAGIAETFTIGQLSDSSRYYFAIKTADEVPNWSGLSNVVSALTLARDDLTPPAAVTDLTVVDSTLSSLTLQWTAPGDDSVTGTATAYRIVYSGVVITEGNFALADSVLNPPAPQAAGSVETFEVLGLNTGTTYYFALKSVDDEDNLSGISNSPQGTTVAGSSAARFDPAVSYTVGDEPVCIHGADFDGDSDIDLVTANGKDGTVSVLLNDGSGVFGGAVSYTSGSGSHGVFAVDVSRDSDPDLVVANFGDNSVAVLRGAVAATFAVPWSDAAGLQPEAVCVANFDGDIDLDIVTANVGSNDVSVLLNDGNGNFGASTEYDVGSGPGDVVVADLNGDGRPDLATANIGSGNVSVLLGNGDGTFGVAVSYDAGAYTGSICAADLDQDSDSDLVVTNLTSDNVSVLLGNGDGTFASAVNYATGDSPSCVRAADLDLDGNLDLAVANKVSDNVSVLLGVGDGTFAPAVNHAAGDGAFWLFAADLDGDGDIDLAVANAQGDDVSILLNQTID